MVSDAFNGHYPANAAAQTVSELTDIIGFKLTAFVARVRDTEIVRRWTTGELRPGADALARIEFARDIAKDIAAIEGNALAQAVMTGQDPILNLVSMLRTIRQAETIDAVKSSVIAAKDSYLANVRKKAEENSGDPWKDYRPFRNAPTA